ncbi:DNA-directed RNA polymerase (mitochondrial precursor), putative [Theileria annulata]|uniref:DNA-directed RNA polymerase n=1 Tax=Theileria annulata TaxID=5874 RepID=Q4UIH0_THEAN|nr:DNA-directed RNA polymerase (mitochondrial precursor), putative [Theileria annulata]CAI73119.1 DNA-directed RNA polymerase (mitochondrial precursor), putative [Theileria annulata]|eukprot:XP_953797.1 DNA-directed RNA polymerase (mitochondrial precursor), putative [Theileria annulata]
MVRPIALNTANLNCIIYRNKGTTLNSLNLNKNIHNICNIQSISSLNKRNYLKSHSIHSKILKRDISSSQICFKSLDSSTQEPLKKPKSFFSIGSEVSSTETPFILDKITPIHSDESINIPNVDKDKIVEGSKDDSDVLLRNVKSVVFERAEDISKWLRTNKQSFLKNIEEQVIHLFRNAEKFSSIHGLLLADVSPDDFKSHVDSVKSISNLFSPQFIRKQKKKLYKDNDLPLLCPTQNDKTDITSETSEDVNFESVLSQKRQELIEKLSFSEALETAKVEASNLLDFKHPSELSSLSSTCTRWIQDISQFIKKDREKGGTFVIPLELEEEILATTTVKIVLQSMCFPSYTLDSRGNKGGLLKKRIQQTNSNQILISHLAIKLGDEIGKLYNNLILNNKEAENVSNLENSGKKANTDSINSIGSLEVSSDEKLEKDCNQEDFIEIKSAGNGAESNDRVVVKSSLNAVIEPLNSTNRSQKNWNSSQSAAAGGYLLNALIKSCRIELDLQTALKQYLSNYSCYVNQSMDIKTPKLITSNSSQNDSSDDSQESDSQGGGESRVGEISVRDKASVVGGKSGLGDDKLRIIMRFLNVIKKSRFNESLVEVEAFRHVLLRQGVKTFGVLEMRESCMLKLRDFVAKSLVSLAALPMVCKPKRWINATTGGSILLKHNFIRGSKLNEVKVYDLGNVFDIVNKFSQVPWIINRQMLNLIKHICSSQTDMQIKQHLPVNTTTNIMENINTSISNITSLSSNELSELSLFLRRIKIADAFANEKRLYMPLNIDFRGRMYPLSPYLNHMNDDLCRSLLLFSEKRKLGNRGLFWLKVHCSNMYGNDKISFEDRVKWVDEHIAIITELVKSPFKDFNQNFWVKADKPFQFFASCVELVRAIESNNPDEYMTHLPIQQDGTCNGLQHYAALGLDERGAKYVNLVNSEQPQDLYTHILQLIIQKVYNDLNYTNSTVSNNTLVTSGNGKLSNVESNKKYSEICVNNNILCRKVIKQTVMTICYGVTRIGAIDQVESKLKDIKKISYLSPSELRGLAAYLANKILSSISTIFSEAMSIKNWLDEISCVHNKFNIPVTWISPIGLPCEQPYCKSVTKVVRTPLQAINVSKYVSSVDKRRQKLAFPPNFIHSLDASHLMMTATEVFKHTQSFATVHDSYWIHPDKVDMMHTHIRNEFFNMHTKPILDDLHKSVLNKLQIDFRPPPKKGNFNLEHVLDSKYFFH